MSVQNKMIQIDDLYKQYGDKVILDNIDLSVADGELCTVVGPSGCGKSTLLRLILGQEQPTSGSLLIDGVAASTPDTQRGIVYQKYSLFPNLSVLDNVTLGRRLQTGFFERRRRRGEFEEEAMHYLKQVRLDQHAHKYPYELSGGMQQRAAIAQTLIMHPRILLMDEPFGALDPQTREDLQLFLLELWEEKKMTIFFVTHSLEEAIYLGTRTLLLSQYYTDNRGEREGVKRGAKIVADYDLGQHALRTAEKKTEQFNELEQRLLSEGFDPNYIQHATEFNLKHGDSFQTLTTHEHL